MHKEFFRKSNQKNKRKFKIEWQPRKDNFNMVVVINSAKGY